MKAGRTVRGEILALALLAGLPGCRAPDRPGDPQTAPGEERRGPEVVALLPVRKGPAAQDLDADEFAQILAAEWTRSAGVRVIRPGPGEAPPAVLEDALRRARGEKADVLVALTATRYDPYDPPAIGLAAQVFRAEARPLPEEAVDRLVRSASWRSGPLPLGRPAAGHWITAFERDYDARDRGVRERLRTFVRERTSGDSAFDGEREFLAVQPRYLQFVAGEIVRDLLRALSGDGP